MARWMEEVGGGGGGGADKELQYKLDFQQFVNARISFSIVVVVVSFSSSSFRFERYQNI